MLTMMTSTSATPIPINTFFQVFMNHPAGPVCLLPETIPPVAPACPRSQNGEGHTACYITVTLLPGRKFPMQALAVWASVKRQRGNLPSEHYSLPEAQ